MNDKIKIKPDKAYITEYIEMFEKGDKEHTKAMEEIRSKMSDTKSMIEWIGKKREEFNALPDR